MASIKQGLEQKQQQRLSPLQIQTIKVIEMPVQALEQYVREVLNDNPVIDDDAPKRDDDQPRDVSISEVEERSRAAVPWKKTTAPRTTTSLPTTST